VVLQEISEETIEEEEVTEEETAPLTSDRHHLALAGTRAFIIIKSSPLFSYVALIDLSFCHFLLSTTHHINIFGFEEAL